MPKTKIVVHFLPFFYWLLLWLGVEVVGVRKLFLCLDTLFCFLCPTPLFEFLFLGSLQAIIGFYGFSLHFFHITFTCGLCLAVKFDWNRTCIVKS
jgi:hypothetical protein